MSDGQDERDHAINRMFAAVREGIADLVTNLADRVDREIRNLDPDERHQSPGTDYVLRSSIIHAINVVTGLFTRSEVHRGEEGDDAGGIES